MNKEVYAFLRSASEKVGQHRSFSSDLADIGPSSMVSLIGNLEPVSYTRSSCKSPHLPPTAFPVDIGI